MNRKPKTTPKQIGNNSYIPDLPPGLETVLERYQKHCEKNGLRSDSIDLYLKEDRWFLHCLSDCGCTDEKGINASRVANACGNLTSMSYLATVRTFLRYLASSAQTDRDYSYVVPPYKRPQPLPSVYSEDEIQRMESAVNRTVPPGKRNYVTILLASRLGLRSGDIATLTFNELDFDNEVIRLVQQKTEQPLELPMLPELKAALRDYIDGERPCADTEFVLLNTFPPHNHISVVGTRKVFFKALTRAGISADGRGQCARAMRSSLASSMVNSNVPYEVVRRTLGHNDPNVISHYARLNMEELRKCAVPVQGAAGLFAKFLMGGRAAL